MKKKSSRREEELTVTMSRILSRLWTLSPGNTSFTTGSVPSWRNTRQAMTSQLVWCRLRPHVWATSEMKVKIHPELHLHSPGCRAPGIHPGPHRCCRLHLPAWKDIRPPAARWTPCGDTAPGRGASRNDPGPYDHVHITTSHRMELSTNFCFTTFTNCKH